MNDIKVSCIDSRKMALMSSYEGNDPKILNMIDEFLIELKYLRKIVRMLLILRLNLQVVH